MVLQTKVQEYEIYTKKYTQIFSLVLRSYKWGCLFLFDDASELKELSHGVHTSSIRNLSTTNNVAVHRNDGWYFLRKLCACNKNLRHGMASASIFVAELLEGGWIELLVLKIQSRNIRRTAVQTFKRLNYTILSSRACSRFRHRFASDKRIREIFLHVLRSIYFCEKTNVASITPDKNPMHFTKVERLQINYDVLYLRIHRVNYVRDVICVNYG